MQALLQRVTVRPNDAFTNAEPDQRGTRVTIATQDGRALVREQMDYEGFPMRPATWGAVEEKFRRPSEPSLEPSVRMEVAAAVKDLETVAVRELTALLARARPSPA